MTIGYGVFSLPGRAPRCGLRIGEQVLDLAPALKDPTFDVPCLNPFLAQGRARWRAVHEQALAAPGHRHGLDEVEVHLPIAVADYTDFYASEHHARNLGRILRPGGPELPPNWKHQPLGYHGRSGTVVVSGTPVRRPSGQITASVVGPSQRLDYEVELGFVVGAPTGSFEDQVFGVCLVNDWSARDLQAFETVPLGPFLGKSFATSISPWIVPLELLSWARVPSPERSVELVEYLRATDEWGLDVRFEVAVNGTVRSRPNSRDLYWTGAQMLAHLQVNGARMRTGDLFASGTVSSPGQVGSLIELNADASQRLFLQDGDTVTISATAPGVDLGSVTGTVLRAGS